MLSLYDIITLPSEEIIKKVNKKDPTPSTYEEDINNNNYLRKKDFSLKNYKNLLSEEDVFVGKKFHLLNNLEVKIVDFNKNKNFVLVEHCFFPYLQHKLKYNKLIKNLNTENFPKKGENYYYKNKNNERILITIKYVSISQKSVGYIDNGKKIYVKVSKLIPLDTSSL